MGKSVGGDEVHGDKHEFVGDFRNAKITIGAGPPQLSPEEIAALLADHRAAVLADTAHLDLRGIPLPQTVDGRRITMDLPLERVYVRLRAVREEHRRGEEEAKRRELEASARVKMDEDYLRLVDRLGEYLYTRLAEERAEVEPVDPEAALREKKQLVVLGPPGAGKSTLLRLLARQAAADAQGSLPLLVPLGRYAAQLSRGDVALVDFALERLPAQRRWAVQAAAESGRVLWLLDALDEAREAAPRVLAQLGDLRGQLVLTSRPLGYDPGPAAGLAHYELLPLDAGEVAQFLSNWFSALAEAQGLGDAWAAERVQATQARLADRPGLRPLLGNPLLLTFVAVLAGKDPAEALPSHRAGLYRRYLEDLLESWEGQRRVKSGAAELAVGPLRGVAGRAALRDGLVWLSWWLHLTYYGGHAGRPPLEREAVDALAAYFRTSGDYDDLRRHESLAVAGDVVTLWREAGLLDVWHLHTAGGPVDFLAIRHLTFQEYGAAVVLAQGWREDRARAWTFLQPRLHHRAWREPLLLMGGLLGAAEADDLLGATLGAASPYEEVLRRDLRAGMALAGEGKGEDRPGHEALAGQLVESIRRAPVYWTRSIVADALAPLSRFLKPTVSAVLPAQHVELQLVPTWAAKVASELLAIMADWDDSVRWNVARAIGWIGDMGRLLASLRDPDGRVRQAAAQEMTEIVNKAALRLLPPPDGEDGDDWWAAVDAPSKMGAAVSFSVTGRLAALRDEDSPNRQAAAEALGKIGDTTIVSELLAMLQDKDDFVRWAADRTLRVRGEAAVPGLLATLEIQDHDLRLAAAAALGAIGGHAAAAGLLVALQDKDFDVRWAAAKALGEIGDAAAVPGLLAALQDEEGDVRAVAAEALGRLGDVAAELGLLALLQDEVDHVRQAAARALGMVGDAMAVPGLLAAVGDACWRVQQAATEALKRIAKRLSREELVAAADNLTARALSDPDGFSEKAFRVLEHFADHLSTLDVAALPTDDLLLPPL